MFDPKRIDEEIRPITMMLLDSSTEIKKEWIVALLMDLDAMMTWGSQEDFVRILQDVKDIMERRLQLRIGHMDEIFQVRALRRAVHGHWDEGVGAMSLCGDEIESGWGLL